MREGWGVRQGGWVRGAYETIERTWAMNPTDPGLCVGSAYVFLPPVDLPLKCLRIKVMPLGTHAQAVPSDQGSMCLRTQSWQDGRIHS